VSLQARRGPTCYVLHDEFGPVVQHGLVAYWSFWS